MCVLVIVVGGGTDNSNAEVNSCCCMIRENAGIKQTAKYQYKSSFDKIDNMIRAMRNIIIKTYL